MTSIKLQFLQMLTVLSNTSFNQLSNMNLKSFYEKFFFFLFLLFQCMGVSCNFNSWIHGCLQVSKIIRNEVQRIMETFFSFGCYWITFDSNEIWLKHNWNMCFNKIKNFLSINKKAEQWRTVQRVYYTLWFHTEYNYKSVLAWPKILNSEYKTCKISKNCDRW